MIALLARLLWALLRRLGHGPDHTILHWESDR